MIEYTFISVRMSHLYLSYRHGHFLGNVAREANATVSASPLGLASNVGHRPAPVSSLVLRPVFNGMTTC